jgi:HAE1 family hydrophobic/amphiphilic exporter-1
MVAVVFGLIMITGLYMVSDIALDLMPNIERPFLSVSTSYPGASPESVEKTVTAKLESALINVSGLIKLTSSSSEGSSRLSLEFGYGVDLDEATNDIRDKLDRVRNSLPDDADSPRIFKFNADDIPIIRIAISGKRGAEELKTIAEQYIQPYLEQVDGVAQAAVNGGRSKIVRVELSQNRLDAYGLTITGIASSLATQNIEMGGGSIGEGTKDYLIRTVGEFGSVAEIASTVIATLDGYGVKLSDVGEVSEGYADKRSVVYVNGEPGVYVSLSKRSGTNTVKAADAIYAKMEEIQKLLPADVKMEIVSDQTLQIRGTINNLLTSAWQGGLLAMAILFLFLRTLKSTIIVGISIPFSILVTLLAMFLAGITLNMMTMTGLILGIGMIVDASIVILENIYQYRERGAKPKVAAILGSHEMMSAIIASNLTTIFVFIPMLFFKDRLGILGQIFTDMIFTIVISLLSSLFVAIFLIPVLASTYLPLETRKEKPIHNRFLAGLDRRIEGAIEALTRAYRKALDTAIHHRPTTVLIVVGVFLVSLSFIPRMNINLMPPSSDDAINLNVTLPVGTKLSETEAVMLELQKTALEDGRKAGNIITTAGRGSNSHSGQLTVQLPAFKERKNDAEAVKEKLRTRFDDFPNAKFNFSLGSFRQMSGGADIDVAIRTQDLDAGIAMARSLIDLLEKKIPDVKDVSMSLTEGLPQVEVIIDRARAYSFGVNVQSVARELYASVAGTTATTYREAGSDYAVVLSLREEDRMKVPDLERIYVKGTAGRVALANFARLEKGVGPVSIARENQSRIIHVTATISTQKRPGDVELDIQAAVAESMVIPEGMTLGYEGAWRDIVETGTVFIMILTMALFLVFGVMAGQYESWKDPLINMFTIPLLVIGVVAVYAISGEALTMFTAIGVVMLVGIVVNNSIVLVDYTNLLVKRGMPVREACVAGGAARMRPILMTTLTTILGLAPMAFSTGENSQMIKPIGLTVLGGLSSAMLITLFFIPVIYSFFNEKRPRPVKEARQ